MHHLLHPYLLQFACLDDITEAHFLPGSVAISLSLFESLSGGAVSLTGWRRRSSAGTPDTPDTHYTIMTSACFHSIMELMLS